MGRVIEILNPESGIVAFCLEFTEQHDTRQMYDSLRHLPNLFLITGRIICDITDVDDRRIGLGGEAWCYRTDAFDSKKGERVALRKALKTSTDRFNRSAREVIWKQYLEARPIGARPLTAKEAERAERKRRVRRELEQRTLRNRRLRKPGLINEVEIVEHPDEKIGERENL